MTSAKDGRKPPGTSWESWIDQQIRDGMERGEFENLPGKGRPLPAAEFHDEDWWLKAKLRRERLNYLPPTLRVRKELEEAREAIAATDREAVVRAIVADINERIRDINRRGAEGPPSTLMPLDVEDVVRKWREARQAREAQQ